MTESTGSTEIDALLAHALSFSPNEHWALCRAIAAAVKDAERYRWMRKFGGDTNGPPDLDEPTSPEHFDSIIDAAISAGKQGEGDGS